MAKERSFLLPGVNYEARYGNKKRIDFGKSAAVPNCEKPERKRAYT
jgi:hypothetical protein